MSDTHASQFCTSCGQGITLGSRFCIHCGASQNGDASTVPTTTPSPSQASEQSTPQPAQNTAQHTHASSHECPACGGGGVNLPPQTEYCYYCRWLRPLAPDYEMNANVFMWEFDAAAMSKLRSIAPLNAMANRISESIGRPWLEAAVNGVRLGEDQLPDIFALAIRAARIMGLPTMPEVYISGENMWDAITLGSEHGCFVSLGSVLTNMRGDDLLFILAREMGHVAAGHALWRTVAELAQGRKGQESIMGSGVLEYINPAKIVQGAIQTPLLAWRRHSQITADRAALLTVGKEDVAERVLMQWALKSFPIVKRINSEAWRRQEEQSDDATIRMSEWMMTSNPYLARRMKILREFVQTDTYTGWRKVIEYWTKDLPDFSADDPAGAQGRAPRNENMVRLRCAACREPMRVPRAMLEGDKPVNVRCPNQACRKVNTIKPRKAPKPGAEAMTSD